MSMDRRITQGVLRTAKVVTVVDTAISQVSHVRILDLYLSKVPPEKPTDQFPPPFAPTGTRPWYWAMVLDLSTREEQVAADGEANVS